MSEPAWYRGERADEKRFADWFSSWAGECKGGRLIVAGYVCIHCNSSDPTEKCLAPKGKRKPKDRTP